MLEDALRIIVKILKEFEESRKSDFRGHESAFKGRESDYRGPEIVCGGRESA